MNFDLKNTVDKIIIVDPGKNAVKIFAFNTNYELIKRYSFPSKTMKKRTFADIDGSSEDQYKIELDGEKFVIGDGIVNNYNFETTKNNNHHKLCIYTAIANLVKKPNERIYLILGYPSSDFTNNNQKEKYIDLIKPQSEDELIEMTVNGELKTFTIKDISVFPEGIAMRPRMNNHGKDVHIVDIGGQNINYREYDSRGNTLSSFSLDKAGINHLEEYIKNQLRKFVRADIISVEAINILKAIEDEKIEEIDGIHSPENPVLNAYSNSAEFMEDSVLTFMEQSALGQLLSKGVNLYQRGKLIIFTGGGSIILKPYLEKLLINNNGNMYFSNTAQWDNCISYVTKDLGERGKKHGKIKEAQILAQKAMKQVIVDELTLLTK